MANLKTKQLIELEGSPVSTDAKPDAQKVTKRSYFWH